MIMNRWTVFYPQKNKEKDIRKSYQHTHKIIIKKRRTRKKKEMIEFKRVTKALKWTHKRKIQKIRKRKWSDQNCIKKW